MTFMKICVQHQNKTALILMNFFRSGIWWFTSSTQSIQSRHYSAWKWQVSSQNFQLYWCILSVWMCLAIWSVGLIIWGNTALIGIANNTFNHELGCGIHPHFWQIMLLSWWMCRPLHYWTVWVIPMTSALYATQPDLSVTLNIYFWHIL